MKIKMLTCLSGEAVYAKPGDVIEMPDAEAKRHIAAGNAEAVAEAKLDAKKAGK